jgi:ACT domain-containing protein
MPKVLYEEKRNSVAEICWTHRISRTTFYRYMKG